MKILYGVVGAGMGHATRSRVVLEHLRRRGHEVRIVASDGAASFLDRHFGTVLPIAGMQMIFDEKNRIARLRTAASILLGSITGLPRNVATYLALAEEGFEPDVVISDFESWAHLYAKIHGIPILSLDNIQIVGRCRMPPEVLRGRMLDYFLNRLLVRSKLPGCDHYFLTSFFTPEVDAPRTSIHPPILRREILEAAPERGDHVLVYQSGGVDASLLESLRASGTECRAYGMRRNLKSEVVDGNVRHRPFDEASFIDDLRTSRAVVASGGATLMSEALHLGKPVLATPIKGQFEQNMNSIFLEGAGYGRMASHMESSTVGTFLGDLSRHEDALAMYDRGGNGSLLSALDERLELLYGRGLEPAPAVERGAEWASVR